MKVQKTIKRLKSEGMNNMAIPELLKTISGIKIESASDWENFRRPEIVNLFSEYVYGVRPVKKPTDLNFSVKSSEKNYNDKKINCEKITISFSDYSFDVFGFIPETETNKKLPAFIYVMHEFEENKSDIENSFDCEYINFKELFNRGYAIFVMHTSGVAPDWDHKLGRTKGVYTVFDRKPVSDNAWATISAWAWGASRVMDYIETKDCIDPENVSVAGHSRGGKTALWCGATDTRIKCAFSNNSGCTGAAIHRTKVGEHIKDINITDWFCKNYHKFNDNEDMLPVDQHMLIASMAPRLAYVSSSSEDEWADPAAERLSCKMASEAYELYNMTGAVLPDEEDIEKDIAYHDGNIGYHVKTGKHSITHFDWKMYLDFLDLKK